MEKRLKYILISVVIFIGLVAISDATANSAFLLSYGNQTLNGSLTVSNNITGNFVSINNNSGITDNSSYWLCNNVGCLSTCQVQIENGLIIGCA